MESLKLLIDEMQDIEKLFQKDELYGMETIYKSLDFKIWRAKLQLELSKVDNIYGVSEVSELLGKFNGWKDRSVFDELKAQLPVVYKAILDSQKNQIEVTVSNNKVFLVHGRNHDVRNAVELALRRVGLDPIILSGQANNGNTIIEKIEKHSDVGCAIVIYTSCDEGKYREDEELSPRARQNVVFEHGYMMGLLSRTNVAVLVDPEVELPGDIAGLGYISLDSEMWQHELLVELAAKGINVDWTKLHTS